VSSACAQGKQPRGATDRRLRTDGSDGGAPRATTCLFRKPERTNERTNEASSVCVRCAKTLHSFVRSETRNARCAARTAASSCSLRGDCSTPTSAVLCRTRARWTRTCSCRPQRTSSRQRRGRLERSPGRSRPRASNYRDSTRRAAAGGGQGRPCQDTRCSVTRLQTVRHARPRPAASRLRHARQPPRVVCVPCCASGPAHGQCHRQQAAAATNQPTKPSRRRRASPEQARDRHA